MMELRQLQESIYTFITEPGTIEQALQAAGPQLPHQCVLPSSSLSPLQRLTIYRNMYLGRMEEALSCDYPGLQAVLGEERFSELVADYVKVHPSRSHTLDRLGDQFIPFLQQHPRWGRPFWVDLARAEWAIVQVHEEREDPPLQAQALLQLSAEQWGQARLRPIAALRLVALDYPVQPLLSALRQNHPLPRPRRRPGYFLVWRRNYQLWRQQLTPRMGRLLRGLLDGQPLDVALAGAGRFSQQALFQTFGAFMQDQLFSQIEI